MYLVCSPSIKLYLLLELSTTSQNALTTGVLLCFYNNVTRKKNSTFNIFYDIKHLKEPIVVSTIFVFTSPPISECPSAPQNRVTSVVFMLTDANWTFSISSLQLS